MERGAGRTDEPAEKQGVKMGEHRLGEHVWWMSDTCGDSTKMQDSHAKKKLQVVDLVGRGCVFMGKCQFFGANATETLCGASRPPIADVYPPRRVGVGSGAGIVWTDVEV